MKMHALILPEHNKRIQVSERRQLLAGENWVLANFCGWHSLVMASCFSLLCLLHSVIYVVCGSLMMFYPIKIFDICHGKETASKLLGSTPHDHILIRTSESLVGMLLVTISIILFMVSFVKDREFQIFFSKGCILIHALMGIWRFYFERRVEDLARDWPRQAVGDFIFSLSWVFFLIFNWREKYD